MPPTVEGCLRQIDFSSQEEIRTLEAVLARMALSRQGEAAYRRLVSDWQASGPRRTRVLTPGAHRKGRLSGKPARQTQ